uniref:Uncharacterized protein n=1 Tax=uncultured Desulfobacterium sp. TaxID=201089 RepID=E1YCS8_9BACT|nr:unknown protein [uncultured Desulfobacterium sp.]
MHTGIISGFPVLVYDAMDSAICPGNDPVFSLVSLFFKDLII